ncbi:MAG TPA: hypothetical protein VE650_13035 [Acetobacteraceae bacterium]|nr:hypothetical protein [Acetobacteraceae bacterium]
MQGQLTWGAEEEREKEPAFLGGHLGEAPDRLPGSRDRHANVLCLEGRKRVVVGRVPSLLRLDHAGREQAQLARQANSGQIRRVSTRSGGPADFNADFAQPAVVERSINEGIARRVAVADAYELVREGGEGEVEDSIVAARDRPAQVDLSGSTRRLLNRPLRLIEEVIRVQRWHLL